MNREVIEIIDKRIKQLETSFKVIKRNIKNIKKRRRQQAMIKTIIRIDELKKLKQKI